MSEEKKYDDRGREQVKAWYCLIVTTMREKAIRDRLVRISQNERFKDQIFRVILPAVKEVKETYTKKEQQRIDALEQRMKEVSSEEERMLLQQERDSITPKRKVKEKILPEYTQYIFVEMILNDDTYHAVKIDGVRHIQGDMEGPTPIQDEEMKVIFKMIGEPFGDESEGFEEGDRVTIIDSSSAFQKQTGTILNLHSNKKEATVSIIMFGKETKVTVSLDQIYKKEN
ncbi:hypothetical protein IMZ31_20425 (plasmid) [Pontibacillus sp. ALD_SL1]|uniref:transcription termination/antitermination protein NusG n=1 Tax=Pontibacillus sp. ALD_SL1 TaxID=2777185 RepID=UPI001A957155|nr:transcription termination/antitermination NusG family protein [Pontibacillus sp. ALD_SL1]QST02917.1 hypothetical protein IMZ31_20425 [Pontibacillus sp. ALD_SL1]